MYIDLDMLEDVDVFCVGIVCFLMIIIFELKLVLFLFSLYGWCIVWYLSSE